ncbi:MAG: glutamate formiminotransferase, partial [Ignavibacteriaceae bacterium]
MKIIECVPNFSEGANTETFEAIKNALTPIKNVKLL